jgi:TRAP-type uncharacterized transport system substrate-binding protein
MTPTLPRWARIAVLGVVVTVAASSALMAYRHLSEPVTLTVATGALDDDGTRLVSAIATRLVAARAPVRLKVVEKASMLDTVQTFSKGEVDLAIVRGDLGGMSAARTVVKLTHLVVMLLVPPGPSAESFADLKNKAIGVVGGPVNRRIVEVLGKEYDTKALKVQWKDLALSEVQGAVAAKQVDALLVVTPVSEKFINIIRGFFPRDGKKKPSIIPIDAAEAIAALSGPYESFELPKGTLRASPPIPDEDLTTLRVPVHLVAKDKVAADNIAALTRAIMEARSSLSAELPLVVQFASPNTDKDASIPIHPGAAAYFAGEEKTFFEKYSDHMFYGPMLLGMASSLLVALLKFVRKEGPKSPSLERLTALTRRVREASGEELDGIEDEIDVILASELAGSEGGRAEPAGLQISVDRLTHLIEERRRALFVYPRQAYQT